MADGHRPPSPSRGGLKLKITFITLVMDVKTLGTGDRTRN
jgi:hypothetical protein